MTWMRRPWTRLALFAAPDLRRLVVERCESFTSGDCTGQGLAPFLDYTADRYCDPCRLRYTLGMQR